MSYGLYVGKNLTASGIAYLGGYGDEPSGHWLEVIPRMQHAAGATLTVGVTAQADMPGVLSEIPEAPQTLRHVRTSYSHYKGVPAPLTNGGLNEFGVAVRDIWSTSRAELIAMTPADQSGPNYSDLARIVMQRARTARAAVELIGRLIAEHGYSTYGGNSHLIADDSEAWVVIECAGGVGLWAAERLGDDSIRASRPGYIEAIPVEQPDHPDYLYAPNLVSFARAQGWYASGEFNFNRIYGDGKGRWAGVAWIEGEMRNKLAGGGRIGLQDMIWAVRTPKLTGDTAGYGQLVPLADPGFAELRYLWHTQVGAIAAPFVPVFIGMREVPEEYRRHRYLGANEAASFMDNRKADADSDSVSPVSQGVESTRSACAVFKRLMYLLLQNQDLFLDQTVELWTQHEAALAQELESVTAAARILLQQGATELARFQLDYFSRTELLRALDLADRLGAAMEARTRILRGIRDPAEHRSCEQIW